MMLELGFAALVAFAWKKAAVKPKMTEKLSENYLAALEHCSDPATLRKLAAEYEKFGFRVEAEMLKKRAVLRAMPPEKKREFRALATHAIAKPDSNPEALDAMANGFDAMTANGTARDLRARARERREEILAAAEVARKEATEKASAAETRIEETPGEAAVTDTAILASPSRLTDGAGEEVTAIHGE